LQCLRRRAFDRPAAFALPRCDPLELDLRAKPFEIATDYGDRQPSIARFDGITNDSRRIPQHLLTPKPTGHPRIGNSLIEHRRELSAGSRKPLRT
jgi:hypothetical protein